MSNKTWYQYLKRYECMKRDICLIWNYAVSICDKICNSMDIW